MPWHRVGIGEYVQKQEKVSGAMGLRLGFISKINGAWKEPYGFAFGMRLEEESC